MGRKSVPRSLVGARSPVFNADRRLTLIRRDDREADRYVIPSIAEDDGWLLAFVHDLKNESTVLVVMDAADFERGYVTKVTLPQRVPFGFHGNWIGD